MKPRRVLLVAIAVGTLGASIAALAWDKLMMPSIAEVVIQSSAEGELPAFRGAVTWLNSDPLTAAELKGKVVLVNFWTFTCINWLRQLPYVRAWAAKYKDQGLVVIGVHTPEFEFEHDIDGIRRAATEMRVDYPVPVDNGYAIWRAFANQYWPALYFVDARGRVRHHRFGEGEYEQSERVIQRLLADAGTGHGDQGLVAVEAQGIEAAADWSNLRSPETYLGHARAGSFVSGNLRADIPNRYAGTSWPSLNGWTLWGVWTVGREFAALNEASGRIAMRFHARDLHLVLAPSVPGRPVRFRVRLDDAPPGTDHGTDIDADGVGVVKDGRLYQLIRQKGAVDDRTFEIEFLDPGVRAYAFTFG